MQAVWLIALNTFRESVRSKILYSVIFFAIVLVGVSALFGSVTIGDQINVIKDFGLFSISIFAVLYAVISGSTLLDKELTKKTIYNILSKSVHRWQFLLGKYLGMLITEAVLVGLMGLGLLAFLALFDATLHWQLCVALCYLYLELVIVCAAVIFFSTIVVTPLLGGVFSFGVFLAGRSAEYLLYFIKNGSIEPPLSSMLQGLYLVLPHLDQINISDLAVYGRVPELSTFWLAFGYSFGYAAVLLVIANMLFRRRDFL